MSNATTKAPSKSETAALAAYEAELAETPYTFLALIRTDSEFCATMNRMIESNEA